MVLNEPRCPSDFYPHLIFLVDFGGEDEGGERDAPQVFGLSLKNTEIRFGPALPELAVVPAGA